MYLFFIPLFIVSSWGSESLSGPISLLNDLNDVNIPAQNICTEESVQMQKCAQEVCGPPDKKLDAALTDATFDQYVQPGKMTKFGTVEKDLGDLIDMHLKTNEAYLAKLKEDLSKTGGTIDVKTLTPFDYGNLANRRFFDFARFTTDPTKPFNERVSFIFNFPPNASEVLKKGVTAFAEERKRMMETSFTQGYYDGFYTPEESDKILREKWNSFLKDYEAGKKADPTYMQFQNEIIEKFKTELDTSTDLSYFISQIDYLESSLVYAKTGSYAEPKYLCSHEDCQKAVQEELSQINFNGMIQELEENAKDRKKLTERMLAQCKSQFAMKTIQSYQNESFNKMVPQIKAALLKNVAGGYSKHSQEAFKNYLNNEIHLAMRTSTDNEDNFIKRVRESKTGLANVEPMNDQATLLDRAMNLFSYEDYNYKMAPLRMMNVCEDSIASVAWDSFLPVKQVKDPSSIAPYENPNKDNVNVSLFTCTHQQHGKGILAHELGHALSWAFYDHKLSEHSYKEFMKMRTCATNLYKTKPSSDRPVYFDHAGDSFRTEEDMADLIAYKAIPDKTTIVGCSLLRQSEDGHSYEELELTNTYNTDSHSSPFMRVLQEMIHKRKPLPASCKEIIKNNKDDYRFEPCF